MLEVEDKFRVHPGFVLPDLVGAAASVRAPRACRLVSVYHDTEDLRLARSGITLRHRSGEGKASWQLKLPVADGRLGTRDEIDAPGEPDEVPAALLALVVARLRRAELAPRATLVTDRTTYDLLGADDQLLAELVDDHVEAHDGDRPVARFREIEVEDRGGGSRVLDDVGARLRGAGAVQGEFQPKVVRALGESASAPPDPPLPQPVSRRDPARVLVAAALRQHVHHLLDNDVVVRGRLDDDGVHQMRVAARRLRSVLLDFASLLDAEWAAHLRSELQWLGQQLSPARDLQVVAARLAAAIDELPEELDGVAARQQVARVLEPELVAAGEAVDTALASARYLDLVDTLVDAATHPRTTDRADLPVRKVMPPIVHAARKRLAKRFAAAIDSGDLPLHHRARKTAKRTRYLAEVLSPVYGKQARKFASAVKQVQEVLGDHQDAVVAAATLHRVAASSRSARASFALGVLYAGQLQRAAELRAEFAQLAPTVVRPRNQRWVDDR
ncbi:MAG: CYTH and CHAD domain-containing protein [Actinomycetes bacterium]